MKPNHSNLSEYFSFSKKERNAIFILLGLMVIFIILPHFFITEIQPPTIERQLLSQLDSVSNSNEYKAQDALTDNGISENAPLKPFPFDPNLLDEAGWRKMGVREKTIQTIMNYRNKGGYFRTPEDIRKIYGLKKDQADALIPFITIGQKTNRANREDVVAKPILTEKTNYTDNRKSTETSISAKRNLPSKKININTATAEEWKSLPGIGEVLSKRIVKFRTSIGGFKSIEDIKKTYGLKDSVFENIKPMLFLEE